MPASTTNLFRSRRDSWPPAIIRLQAPAMRDHHDDEDHELANVDDDPLTYFLTPAPALDDDEMGDELDMMFDAGIEDAKHPPPIVRSVSPSSLDGLVRRASPRPATPPRSPPSRLSPDRDTDMSSADEEEPEDYVRFAATGRMAPNVPFSLGDLRFGKERGLAAPSTATSTRGRQNHRFGPRPTGARPSRPHPIIRSLSGSQSPSHSWREPSPDVWSIEEETEEELSNELPASPLSRATDTSGDNQGATAIDIPAAKPKKQVRFVLPAKTI